MTFKNPEYFFLIWLLIPLGIVFVSGIRKRRRIISDFLGPGICSEAFKSVFPGYSEKRRIIKALSLMLIFVFLLFSAAGPEYGHTWQEYEAKGVEIILAVDCSRSMLAPDIQPTRLDRAKREIVDLVSMLEGDKVGIVAFSGTAFLQCPLTLDYSGFSVFLNALSPDYLPVGGTDFEAAINMASESFGKNSGSEKALILITDGEETTGDAMKAAKAAKEKGIRIFTIGVGGETAAPIPEEGGGFKKDSSGNMVLSRLDESILKKISEETGGAYVRSVAGDMDLDIIYKKEIRGSMEQSLMKSGKRKILENRFQWPLFIAVLLWFWDMFVPSAGRVSVLVFMIMGSFLFKGQAYADTVYSLMKSAEKAYEKNDYDKAVSDLTAAQVKEPSSSEIFYNLGNTYYRMGQYDAALKSFSGALEHSDDKEKGRIHYNMGNTRFRMQDYKGAIEEYEKVLKIDPEDKNARENIEFTKKVMQDQKNNEPDKKNKDDSRNQDKKDQSDKDQDKKNQDSQNNGSSMDNDQKNPAKDNSENKDGNDKAGSQDKEDNGLKDGKDKENKDGPGPADNGEEKNDAMGQGNGQQGQDQPNDEKGQNADAGPLTGKKDEGQGRNVKESDLKLNRLMDKPGAAMIPSYKKRSVEKDW